MGVELSPEATTAIGALVVSNAGFGLKLFLNWLKERRAEEKEENAEKTKNEVEIALMRKDLQTLAINYGELRESVRDIRTDLNAAYGKWREGKPPG